MLSSCSIKKKKNSINAQFQQTFAYTGTVRFFLIESIHLSWYFTFFYVWFQWRYKLPLNRETYVTEVARFIPLIYIYGGGHGSTSIIVFHASASFLFFFFFGRHTIELSTFLIRFTAQKIILRSCGAMASAASTTRP